MCVNETVPCGLPVSADTQFAFMHQMMRRLLLLLAFDSTSLYDIEDAAYPSLTCCCCSFLPGILITVM